MTTTYTLEYRPFTATWHETYTVHELTNGQFLYTSEVTGEQRIFPTRSAVYRWVHEQNLQIAIESNSPEFTC